ncbi:MAG TPA: NAD(P)/FAD-dependent oxidoreductase [Candidatus Sulfotelmatobacter sp.]|nr:NAD(P)/FAD-dependent oxidoreductase [Candidatus Sulfotelmatobacter sp.]
MSAPTHNFDVVILGGGAAGLMCAIEAGKRGRLVAILEHADRLGKKILISGGGRCNFTNIHCRPENFLSANPHFAKSALARYTPQDFIALIEKHGIPYHEKTLGQLFCLRSARDILTMLEEECRTAHVSIFLNTRIQTVSQSNKFVLRAANGEFHSPVLVVATGGLSIPKIGATSFGYDLARQFGLKIVEPRPGLVPFVLNQSDRSDYSDLSGVSADVIASCNGGQFREKMLFTHRGLSGPAILQISSYWEQAQAIELDLAPERQLTAAFDDPKIPRTLATLKSELRKVLPNRLSDRWLELRAPRSWTNTALADFERQLHHWTLTPAGTEGFEKAEVTAGGVDTDELSAKTMESKNVPGLYFIGEVVDVTGHLGGFNFQWAWASGSAAGRAL